MTGDVLHIENLTMQFGGVVAVNDLTLDVNKGEIVALIGPNGAGKTTVFNCVTGVYAPTNGRIDFLGRPMVRNHPRGKMAKMYAGAHPELARLYLERPLEPTPDHVTKLGMARTFQNIRLWGSQTVFDNVLIAKHLRRTSNILTATLRLKRHEEERMRGEVMDLLREQGLDHLKDEIASSLPYGIQRRLEIARALATGPVLLLLDEPAAGMNPQETRDLASFIRRIRDDYKLTILLIEHHMDLVMDISERIYVLDFGRLIATGTAQAVQNDPRVIEAYLGVADNA